jgi:hypothetical protein
MRAEEQIREIIYGYIQSCELCGCEYPIHKYDPYHEIVNDNYIEYTGKQFLCQKCKD